MRKAKRILALLLVFTLMFSNIGTTMIYATDIQNEPAVSQETEASPAVEPAETEPPIAEPSPEPTPAEPAVEEEPSEEPPAATPEEEPPADEPAATVPAEDPHPADEDAAVYNVRPAEEETVKYATYKFYVGEELVSEQIIKDGETLVEPAVSSQVFKNWRIGDKKNGEVLTFTNKLSSPMTVTETATVNVYAELEDVAYAIFYDEDGKIVSVEQGKTEQSVPLDLRIEVAAGKNHTGWSTTENDTTAMEEGTVKFPKATETVELYPVVVTAHWVTFYSGEGASGVAPQYLEGDVTAKEPTPPTRAGYTFKCWTTEDGEEFNFNTVVTEDIVLLAEWEENTEVTYTVAYWTQRVDDEVNMAPEDRHYDYYGSDSKTYTADSVDAIQPKDSYDNKPVGFEYKNDGKHHKLVQGIDGNYVLNIYFERQVLTYTFYTCEAKEIGSGRDTQWEVADTEVAKWTGLYGQKFKEGEGWDKLNGYSWYYDEPTVRWGQLSWSGTIQEYLEGFTVLDQEAFYGRQTSSSMTIHFCLEEPGENKEYTDYSISSASFRSYTIEANKFAGYKPVKYSYSYQSWGSTQNVEEAVTEDDPEPSFSVRGDALYIYYDLRTYSVEFRSDGKAVDEPKSVKYTVSLANTAPTQWEVGKVYDGRRFTGWYADEACTEDGKVDLSTMTMPCNNLILYAGWKNVTVTIKYDREVTIKGYDTKVETVTTAAGTLVVKPEDPEPPEAGLVFGGWINKADGKPFNFKQPITEDVELEALWLKAGTYTIKYERGEGAGEAPVDNRTYKGSNKAVIKSGEALKTEDGRAFLYWTDGNGNHYRSGAVMDVSKAAMEGDVITLTAVYADHAAAVTVTYYSNVGDTNPDGTVITTYSVKGLQANAEFEVLPCAVSFPGYEFLCWVDSAGKRYETGDKARADADGDNNLYAVWERTAFVVSYVSTGHGTVETESETVDAGEYPGGSVTKPEEGYYFVGWYADKNCEGDPLEITTIPVEEDTVYYAKFAKKAEITITITGKSETKNYTATTQSVTHGVSVLLPEGVNPEDVTDLKYDVVFEPKDGTPAGNVTVKDGICTVSGEDVGTYTGVISVRVNRCPEKYNVVIVYGEGEAESSAEVTLTIKPAELKVEPLEDVPYDGNAQKLKPVVKGIDDAVLTEGEDYSLEYIGDTTNVTEEGVTVKVIPLDNSNYSGTGEATYKITRLPVTFISESASQAYDGTTLTKHDASLEEGSKLAADGHSWEADFTGEQTYQGSSPNAFTVTISDGNDDVSDNYQITTKPGTLTVTAQEEAIVLKPVDQEKYYDGTALTPDNTKFEFVSGGLVNGDYLVVTMSGSATNVNDVGTIRIDRVTAYNSAGEDITSSYTFGEHKTGKLTIKKRPILLTSPNKEKVYDGEALTGDKDTVIVSPNFEDADEDTPAFIGNDGDELRIKMTGEQLRAGSSANSFAWTVADQEMLDNYDITTSFGTLTVTKNPTEIVVKAKDAEKVYDGTELTGASAGYTVTADGKDVTDTLMLENGDTIVVSVRGSALNVFDEGRSTVEVQILHAGEDVTASYANVTAEDGDLTITPLKVTFDFGNSEGWYDGSFSHHLSFTKEDAAKVLPKGLVLKQNNTMHYASDVGVYVPVLSEDAVLEKGQKGLLVGPMELVTNAGSVDPRNYEITVKGSLTIKQRPDTYYQATVSMDGWTYGNSAETPKAEVKTDSHLYAGVQPEYWYESTDGKYSSAEVPTNAGTYTVTATWTVPEKDRENLPDLSKTAEFEIKKRPVTFEAETTATYTGDQIEFALSDELRLQAGSLMLVYEADISTDAVITGTNVAVYEKEFGADNVTITVDGKPVTGNYEVKLEGKLTITAAERPEGHRLSVESYSEKYDAKKHTIRVTGNDLPGDKLYFSYDGGETWSENLEEYTDVVNKTIKVKVENDNYIDQIVEGTVQITPFKISIRIDNKTKTYGTANPVFTSMVSPSKIPGPGIQYTLRCNATETSPVTKPGEQGYLIDAVCVQNQNYNVTVFRGWLTVNAADARNIGATNYSEAYDGRPHSVEFAYEKHTGDKVEYSTDGQTWQTELPQFTDASKNTHNVWIKVTNPNYEDAVGFGTVTITPATLTVTTKTPDPKIYNGMSLIATDGSSCEGLVNSETLTFEVTGRQKDVGTSTNTYKITWDGTAKKDNYTIVERLGTLTVIAKSLNADGISVTRPKSVSYDGKPHKAEGLVVSNEGVALRENEDYELVYSKAEDDLINADTIYVTVKGIGNYTGEFLTYYRISPVPLTITSPDASKDYDGEALTAEGEIKAFVNDEDKKVKLTWASLTDKGSIPNDVEIAWGTVNPNNYTITKTLGTLTVGKKTLDANDVTVSFSEPVNYIYNGHEQKAPITVTYTPKDKEPIILEEGTDYELVYSDDVINAGEKTVTIHGINNYDGSRSQTYQIGLRTLTVTSSDARKPYDGEALSNPGTVTGFADGEADVPMTWASLENVGEIDNDVSIEWNKKTLESNYKVQKELGALEVVGQSIVPGNPDYQGIQVSQPESVEYNGDAQYQPVTVTDANGAELRLYRDYTLTYSDDVTNAGTVTVTITGTDNYTGTVTRTYRITPKELTVTTASAEKVYDSEALTRTNGYTLSGMVFGENVSMRITGSQTAVGTSDNTYSINWGRVNAQNYTITEDLGTLTVTAQSIDPDAGNDEYMGVTVGTLGNVVYNGLTQAVRPRVANAAGRALMSGVDYTITFSADTTNVGEVTATVTGIGNYAGAVTRTYRITPAPLTVNTESATIVFNGGALTAGGRVTGLVNGETVTLNTTGSQTFVGSSENTYEIVWDNARRSNYEIVSETLGTLTVLAAPAAPVAPAAPAAPDAPAPAAEDDPTPAVAPETDPEPAPEPTPAAEDEPVEIEENNVPLAPSTEPEVETIDDNATPLAPGAETHECCILHFLLLLLALCVEIYYTHDRKKRQKHIYELRSEIGSEE